MYLENIPGLLHVEADLEGDGACITTTCTADAVGALEHVLGAVDLSAHLDVVVQERSPAVPAVAVATHAEHPVTQRSNIT